MSDKITKLSLKKNFVLALLIIFIVSCQEHLEIIDDLSHSSFPLVDQTGIEQNFPVMTNGKITVIGYIFTNCPDICPLTTNNMRIIQEKLNEEKISNVEFVTISFDPLQDRPETLRKFAEVRNLDLNNWKFLTGEKMIIDSLMNRLKIVAVISDSTVFKDGRKIYYYAHTDRIQLMDEKGKIRKNYKGSDLNTDEVVSDIKMLH
ncbi:MAG: electron transport protein SCO1/SenC [Ignavibacteria bacterium]|nr:MAG: electron transport protein SCO1/SenC [Ignavibacteria bacterium]KAF0160455.1 MAG: electron transport protein SCO1/SenC [Ignavibacteria bacterium]